MDVIKKNSISRFLPISRRAFVLDGLLPGPKERKQVVPNCISCPTRHTLCRVCRYVHIRQGISNIITSVFFSTERQKTKLTRYYYGSESKHTCLLYLCWWGTGPMHRGKKQEGKFHFEFMPRDANYIRCQGQTCLQTVECFLWNFGGDKDGVDCKGPRCFPRRRLHRRRRQMLPVLQIWPPQPRRK